MADELDFWENHFRQQNATATVNSTAQDRDPEKVARARRLARYANVTPALAEAQPEVIGRMVEAEQNKAVIAQHPSMVGVLQDPDMAAMVGKGNLPALGNILGLLQQPQQRPQGPFGILQHQQPERGATDYYPLARVARSPASGGIRDTVSKLPQAASNIGRGLGTVGARLNYTAADLYHAITYPVDAVVSTGLNMLLPGLGGDPDKAWNDSRQRWQRGITAADAAFEAGHPEYSGQIQRDVLGGIENLGVSLSGLAVGLVTRSPTASASVMGGVTGAAAYSDARVAGKDVAVSALYAGMVGVPETVFELSPAGALLKMGGKSLAKPVVEFIVTEVPGESGTFLAQSYAEWLIIHPEQPMGEWVATLPAGLQSTVIQTLSAGGAQVILARGAQRALDFSGRVAAKAGRKKIDDAVQTMDQGVADHAMLKASMEAVGKHPTAKAAPEAITRFIEAATQDSPIRDVYIPVEAIDALAESDSLSSEEQATLTLYQDQIEEARASGGDVVVPIGDFHTQFQTLFPKLQEDIRLRAGGMSAKEAAVGRDAAIAEIEAIAKELDSEAAAPTAEGEATKTQAQPERTPKQQVYDQVKAQMLKAKRPLVEAQTTALLAASRAETLASSRYGQFPDAMAAHKAIGFTVQKGGSGKNAKAAKSATPQAPAAAPTPVAETPPAGPLTIADKHSILIREGVPLRFHIEQADQDAEIARAWAARPQTEDVFSSTTGDGTQDSERTAYQAAPNTTSEAFKAWFGDSKVVDADGKPLVVYHGSPAGPLEQFDPARIGTNFGYDKQGFFFAGTARDVVSYSYTAEEMAGGTATRMPARGAANARATPAYLSIQNPLTEADVRADPEYTDATYDDPIDFYDTNRKVIERLSAGRDGVVLNIRGASLYAAFEPTQIKSAVSNSGAFSSTDPRIQYQSARGKTDWFKDDPHAVVTLFAEANFSTMLHEMSHVFLEQEFTLAQHPNASPELKADVEKIKVWFAANGHPVGEDGVIPSEAHELWARSGERYFREGNAPSAELRDAFASFKKFLSEVYKSIKALTAYGKAPLSDDIRQVMDRIVATSEAIDDNLIAPMSQTDLGMTDVTYAAYRAANKAMLSDAEDKLVNRAMAAIRARETSRIAEQRKNLRDKLSEEFNQQPGIVALHLLRTGKWLGQPDRESTPVKLNTGWLIDNYGEDILNQLPRGLPIMRGDGVAGDVVAEMTGVSSGDALVKALLGLRAQSDALRAAGDKRSLREAYIAKAVDAAMAQRHGDVGATEESIREEAIATLNSEKQGELLSTEFRYLSRRAGQNGTVTPYQILKEWARTQIGEKRVSEVTSKAALQRYTRAHDKARTAVEKAVLSGDYAEARRQKMAQLINHAQLAEAKRMADALEPIIKRMKRYAEREAMPSMDQDYMDRIHALLAGFSFRPMTQKAIDERNGFKDWAVAQAKDFNEVHIPPRMGDLSVRNYKEAQVADLLELNNAMQSLIHLGRKKQTWKDAQHERDVRETKDDMRSRVLALVQRKLSSLSVGEEEAPFGGEIKNAVRTGNIMRAGRAFRNLVTRSSLRTAAAGLIKMEKLFDHLDGDNTGTGPFNRVFVIGSRDAANMVARLMDEVMTPLVGIYKALDGNYRARLDDLIEIEGLELNVGIDPADPRIRKANEEGHPLWWKGTRMQHITMLLNTGSQSNLSKMVGGEKWGDHESATNLERVSDILWSHASPEDQAFVEAIWEGVGKLWPHIARVERAMTGVVPEKVEAVTMGEAARRGVKGGYWPVVWDSARSKMGEKQAEADDFFGIGIGVSTSVGHTITRTGATAPMEYGLENVLFGHLNKVISRVAYAEWVRDALQFTHDPRITGAINLRVGPEYTKQIEPWIKDQIPSNAVQSTDWKTFEWWLTQARLNASIAVLGLSAKTGLAQTLGLANSIAFIGEGSKTDGMKYMAIGMAAMGKHMAAATESGTSNNPFKHLNDFVFARSEEMSRRVHELNVETADAFRELRKHNNAYRRAQALSFQHIAMIDLYLVSMPTWLGAYAKGLDTGMTEEEAAAYGEKAVRLSQGSGRKKDLAKIQRGGAGQRLFAMFYTPGSVFFNQQWDAVQKIRAGNKSAALMPMFWIGVVGVIADAMMDGDWPDEDEDEDGRLDEFAIWAARNIAFGQTFGVPGVRSELNVAERKMRGAYAEWGGNGWTMAAQGIGKGGAAAWDLASRNREEEPLTGDDIRKISTGVGYAAGVPGLQVGKTGGFAYDALVAETAEPDGTYDWAYGLTYGKLPENKEEAK